MPHSRARIRPLLLLIALVPQGVHAAQGTYSNVVGTALRVRPAYDGSSSERVDVIPILDYRYGIGFVRTVQGLFEGGAQFPLGASWSAGPQLAWEESRKASDSSFLRVHNIPDISAGASIGAHAEWRGTLGLSPAVVVGRLRQNVDTERGLQADLRATLGVYRGGPVLAGVFTQATWASAKAMRTLYGRPGFEPDGGLLFASLGVLGSWDLSTRWALFGSAEHRWVQGDARRSPLAERSSSNHIAVGIGYRF